MTSNILDYPVRNYLYYTTLNLELLDPLIRTNFIIAGNMTMENILAMALTSTLVTSRDIIITLPKKNTIINIRTPLGQPNITDTID